jgi:hypothetical protein
MANYDERALGALLRSLPRVPTAWRNAAYALPRQLDSSGSRRQPSEESAMQPVANESRNRSESRPRGTG